MKRTYRQCTLTRRDNFGRHVELVEWVPDRLAHTGCKVSCCEKLWTVQHVGAESEEPRSAHNCEV